MAKPILIVDDNASDVELALRAFKELPVEFEVEVARDGVEALERLGRAGGACPGLMLLDLKMPRMGGFQVLERVRAQSRFEGVFIAVMTSSSRSEDKDEALRLGADRYVEKPMDFSELVRVLRELTEGIS